MGYIQPADYPLVKLALQLRYYQHTIAAYLGINQGRISEFKNSPLFKLVSPADELPDGFPARP